MAELPTTRNGVPWNAVRTRKMKYDGKLGASAVPILKAVNKDALVKKIWDSIVSTSTSHKPNNVFVYVMDGWYREI